MLRALIKYADFTGRATRSEYWFFMLFQGLVYFTAVVVTAIAFGRPHGGFAAGLVAVMAVVALLALGLFLPNMAVVVRRLHDTGKSAWWLLLYAPSFVPLLLNAPLLAQMAHPSASHVMPMAPMAISGAISLLGSLCHLVLFVFMVMPGTKGANRFGPDPLGLGIDLSVFDDAMTEEVRPAEPYKPVFDFTSPQFTSPQPAAKSAPAAPIRTIAPPASPAASGKPVFGRRGR